MTLVSRVRKTNPLLQEIHKASTDNVAASLSSILSDLPIIINERKALSFGENADNEVFMIAAQRLYEYKRTADVMCNFALGDIWNYWGKQSKLWIYRHHIVVRMAGPDKEAQRKLSNRLSNLGWVANKWSQQERGNYDKVWSTYVRTDPESKWMVENKTMPDNPVGNLFATNTDDPKDTISVTVGYHSIDFAVEFNGVVKQYSIPAKACDKARSRVKSMVETQREYKVTDQDCGLPDR